MNAAEPQVRRWPDDQTLSEKALRDQFARENLAPYVWSNRPGDVYGAHTHAYHKVIVVVRGSITFGLPATGGRIELSAGDRLDLPAGISHNAVVGSNGVVCLEAHR